MVYNKYVVVEVDNECISWSMNKLSGRTQLLLYQGQGDQPKNWSNWRSREHHQLLAVDKSERYDQLRDDEEG